jgi:DNA polymerase (family X)
MSKIETRIPWTEANKIVRTASRRLRANNIKFAFAGSWARKEKTCGDLDLLVLEKDKELVRELLKDIKDFERIEIYGAKKDDWESQLLYLYGSGTFNIMMRSLTKRKGYLLSQYGLFDRKINQRITTNEKKIFKLLGLNWIPPEQRKFRQK